MEQLTHDDATRPRATGLGLALVSAASFGASGAVASGLMSAGWSAAAAVTVRIAVAALVLVVPALVALDGRWHLLRRELRTVLVYGVIAVAGCQLAYFNALRHMEVGPALLIEYLAPVAVLLWVWLRHGERPGRVTAVGAAVAFAGLVLVLDLLSGAHVSAPGVAWALAAMVGVAVYFMLSAQRSELPPIVLATGGLVVGGVALGLAGALGLVEVAGSTHEVRYEGFAVPFWLPLATLGVVSAAVAYVTGIAATRHLGARMASFVALFEVLFALVFAWLLLRQLPHGIQLLGAVLVLVGVVLVKVGERGTATAAPIEAAVLVEI